MKTKLVSQLMLLSAIAAMICSCGVGNRKIDHAFFQINDKKIQIIQSQLKQVIQDKDKIKSHLHPILENIQYLILGLIALFSALISLFQAFQEKATRKARLRNTIVVLGIVSALLSGTGIYLENTIASQKELSNAVNAYETRIDAFFVSIDDILLRKGGFINEDDLNELRKNYEEFNQKIIGINEVFKDNALIQRIGL